MPEREIFEWTRQGCIIKTGVKQRYTLGIVYEPNVEDAQGEWTDEEEIEKACWNFMSQLQGRKVNKGGFELLNLIVKGLEERNIVIIDITDIQEDIQKMVHGLGFMHQDWNEDIGEIVECYIMPADSFINGELVNKGTWMLGVVWSPKYFAKVEKGEITGFSMGGKGRRE